MRKSYCLIVAVALAGCAGPPPDRSTVVGVVRYKGNPVPQGFIHFHSKDNPLVCDSGSIKKDGTYTITNAPVGPVKVVLQINAPKTPSWSPSRAASRSSFCRASWAGNTPGWRRRRWRR